MADIHTFRPLRVGGCDRASDIARLRAQAERQRDIARNATERGDECRLTLTDFWQATAAEAYRRAELATEAALEIERRVAAILSNHEPESAA